MKNEREKLIEAAREQGIVDVDPLNIDTLKLAIELTKKHGQEAYRRLEERRKAQYLKTVHEE